MKFKFWSRIITNVGGREKVENRKKCQNHNSITLFGLGATVRRSKSLEKIILKNKKVWTHNQMKNKSKLSSQNSLLFRKTLTQFTNSPHQTFSSAAKFWFPLHHQIKDYFGVIFDSIKRLNFREAFITFLNIFF